MNSVHEQVLSNAILSFRTFYADVLSELNLLTPKLKRVACREQAYVIRDGLTQNRPLRKYLTDQTEILSSVELVEENP